MNNSFSLHQTQKTSNLDANLISRRLYYQRLSKIIKDYQINYQRFS